VWRVETDGCDWTGSGSAFAVDSRHLVTNHHVIATDVGPELVSPSGDRVHGRVIGASTAADVAVIEVEQDLAVMVPWAPTEALGAGERILAIGYPAPELAFTASSGQIVSFVGPGGDRQALLTDALINRGNSGGPALRADGTVAGVVTQMSVGGTTDHAAIVFATSSVQPLVTGFIEDPQEVLSDCGLGPDYVPTVPEAFTVPAELPPPAPTSSTVPLVTPTTPGRSGTTAPLATVATTTSVPCPGGDVIVTVGSVTRVPGTEPGTWQVTVEVTVADDADAEVRLERAVATVEATDGTGGFLETTFSPPPSIAPGGGTTFQIEGVFDSAAEPVVRQVEVAWGWSAPEDRYCPAAPAVGGDA
jgi:hypothetical protein